MFPGTAKTNQKLTDPLTYLLLLRLEGSAESQ
jgi:hypothetical protein